MGTRLYTNNATSLTASLINPVDTQVTLSTGDGALFPNPSPGFYAICTLEDVSGNIEIVYLTARAGDLCTITRAQEGTTPLTFASGSRFELRITRGSLDQWFQKDGDSLTGTMTLSGGGQITGGRYRDGEIVNSPIRGEPGVTTNQFIVPPGGGPPTIGGQMVYHVANLTAAIITALAYTNGMVIMWYGSLGGIPSGWRLCDGTNGTPDMRDRFIVGAGSGYALGAVGGTVTQNTSSAGAHGHTVQPTALTESQLPPHTHQLYLDFSGSNSDANGFGNFGSAIAGDANSNNQYSATNRFGTPLITGAGSGEAHGHGLTDAGAHLHTVDVRPPYFGIYFIMRTP